MKRLLMVVLLVLMFVPIQAMAVDLSFTWDPPTHWAADQQCPPGGDGPVITVPITHNFKWGTTPGGPYPNVVTTDQTTVTIPNPFGPEGGTVHAIVTAVVLGRESCPSNETVVAVSPLIPNPDRNLAGTQLP